MLVFNKIKAKLGGRVRVIVSGGAPLPEQAEAFLKVAMCAPVVQVRLQACNGVLNFGHGSFPDPRATEAAHGV
eukprot:1143655-Pelagomonas_calceolata.AAC.17